MIRRFEVGHTENFGSLGNLGRIEDKDWLKGLEHESAATLGEKRLLETYIYQGIIEILKKKREQLTQPELRILNQFRETFPKLTLEDLEGKQSKETAAAEINYLDGIENL